METHSSGSPRPRPRASSRSAVFVVRAKNLVHAVLWLGVTLLGTAALYAQLNAPFLAGVQVLTYVGGVVTLMIFGVMVTRRHEGIDRRGRDAQHGARGSSSRRRSSASLASRSWRAADDRRAPLIVAPESTRSLAGAARRHLIAFEALSLLLLAAIVGAVVLARERDSRRGSSRAPRARVGAARERGSPRHGGGRAMTLTLPSRSRRLFCVGIYGLLTRQQAVAMLLSVELMANAANLVLRLVRALPRRRRRARSSCSSRSPSPSPRSRSGSRS